jgi:hypothetical protein
MNQHSIWAPDIRGAARAPPLSTITFGKHQSFPRERPRKLQTHPRSAHSKGRHPIRSAAGYAGPCATGDRMRGMLAHALLAASCAAAPLLAAPHGWLRAGAAGAPPPPSLPPPSSSASAPRPSPAPPPPPAPCAWPPPPPAPSCAAAAARGGAPPSPPARAGAFPARPAVSRGARAVGARGQRVTTDQLRHLALQTC